MVGLRIQPNPTKENLDEIEKVLKDESESGDSFYGNFKSSRARGDLIITLEQESAPIGFLEYYKRDFWCEINIFWIHPELRGNGYGRFFFESFFKRSGSNACRLYCCPKESEKFWKTIGFKDMPSAVDTIHDLTLYRGMDINPLISSKNNLKDFIVQIWNKRDDFYQKKDADYFFVISEEDPSALIIPCNRGSMFKVINNGETFREGDVKYVFADFYSDPFLSIKHSDIFNL